jgi:hypothetical protein
MLIVIAFTLFGGIILWFDYGMWLIASQERSLDIIGGTALLFSLEGALVWLALRRTGAAWHYLPPAPTPPTDAGMPSPLIPSPTHHLTAAKELPPSDETQSLAHD